VAFIAVGVKTEQIRVSVADIGLRWITLIGLPFYNGIVVFFYLLLTFTSGVSLCILSKSSNFCWLGTQPVARRPKQMAACKVEHLYVVVHPLCN